MTATIISLLIPNAVIVELVLFFIISFGVLLLGCSLLKNEFALTAKAILSDQRSRRRFAYSGSAAFLFVLPLVAIITYELPDELAKTALQQLSQEQLTTLERGLGRRPAMERITVDGLGNIYRRGNRDTSTELASEELTRRKLDGFIAAARR